MGTFRVGRVKVDDDSIAFKFHLSKGPGGQKVNKVASAVELRFFAEQSGLPQNWLKRLDEIGGSHRNANGEFVIVANRHRSQKRNRVEAIERLAKLLEKAREIPKPRIPTKPSASSVRERRKTKKFNSRKKEHRRTNNRFED